MHTNVEPTFLIIGAMKAGTTALHHLLVQHPAIFMPRRKELRFFALDEGPPKFCGPGDDRTNENWVATWSDYCDCFAGVQKETAIGEASPFYLYSPGAAQRISRWLPNAKLIIILREPSGRAFSSFQFLRRMGREPLSDFAAALAAEEQRKRDNWEFLWHYRTAGLYKDQVDGYLKLFPRNQIWIGIYDHFVNEPMSFVQSVFRFLEIEDTFRPNSIGKPNVSGVPKIAALDRALNSNNTLLSLARILVPKGYRQAVRTFLTLNNLERATIPPNVEFELKAFYKPDVGQLEELIDRDLSAWKA